MAAVNRLAGTLIASGDYIPVGFVAGAGGDASAANQDEQTALLTTIDADTSNLSVVGGGTEAAAIRVTIANDSTGVVSVDDNGASLTVDGAVTVSGDVAHDAADSGNPIKVGGKALSASPTAVTANDRVNATFNLIGKQIVQPYAHEASFVSGVTTDITTTTPTTLIAAPAAGLKIHATQILVQNSHATVATWVNVTEETSGTILATIYAPAAGGGAAVTYPVPLKVPTAAKALQLTCVTTGANVRGSASGYTAP